MKILKAFLTLFFSYCLCILQRKRILKYRFFFFLIFISATCFSQINRELTVEESVILRRFFRILIEESEAGYVIFNKKPVCIHGFYHKDTFHVNTPSHKESVALREGARIWRGFTLKDSDILIHVCDKEDPFIPGYIHVLVINVPLFQQVVTANLNLFQYILGPKVNSDDLLSALLSNHQTFHQLLKNNKVLIGEILGFGIQNALYVSRIENIQDTYENVMPPFLPSESLTQCHEYLPFGPSFGFTSIKEELEDLQDKVTISSDKLTKNQPEFIFGWLKDSKKTKTFVSELEIVQQKIHTLLDSSSFLEVVLKKITKEKCSPNKDQEFQFSFDKSEINKVIAKGLWESLQDYDFDYLPYFIDALDRGELVTCKMDRKAWLPNYRREFLEGQVNLKEAEDYFHQLETDKAFHCIVPKKLYSKTLKKGQSEKRCNSSLVTVNYSIFSPLGHCLASQSKILIHLKNTISGFAYGIKGMEIGETREIFIHPSLAYGFDTSLEKCLYLRVIVTLLEEHESRDSFSPLQCTDLSFLMQQNVRSEREENYKMALIEKGARVGHHLKKCKEIDLLLIKKHLKHFYVNKEFSETTQLEQDLINQVHWNIYYRN